MATYSTKKIDYGYKEKIAVYANPVTYGKKNPVPPDGRERYEDMAEHKKRKSDENREVYYKRKILELIEIAMMNPDLDVFVTLTFRDSVTSYDVAVAEWQLFLKRLRHLYKDTRLKYICIWEYQQKRSRREHIEKGGIFHFHALMNLGYIEHAVLERIWRQGFVFVQKIPDGEQREKTIRYTVKYCTKELISRIESGEDIRGQRLFFTSNNLLRPKAYPIEEKLNLTDIIFTHLEDMVTDGSYDIKDEHDEIINHVDYAVYIKEFQYN